MFRTGRSIATHVRPRPNFCATQASTRWLLRRYTNAPTLPPVTKIEKLILDSIKATGPVSFATYMQLCLSHPTDGYYMNPSNPVLGSRGDFTTSPEISQVFGELVGIWLLSQWINAGRPPAIRLVELGPGRGTLMDDVLRVVSQFAPKGTLKHVRLVETSLAMRALQKDKLGSKAGSELTWHDSIDDIPPSAGEFTMLVAHELFDALPIHVLQKTEQGWHEVLIASNPETTSTLEAPEPAAASAPPPPPIPHPRLRRVLTPTPTAASTLLGLSSARFQDLPVGAQLEVSPAAFRTARQVGELLSSSSNTPNANTDGITTSPGGCALVVDYGGDKAFGDSFRAFKAHQIVDVFHRPGDCDLTANVDFAYLKEAMADLVTTHGPIPQGAFLERMGLGLRVEALVRGAATEERGAEIADAARRLVDRAGMGGEYQVLGITAGVDGERAAEVWPFAAAQAGGPVEDST